MADDARTGKEKPETALHVATDVARPTRVDPVRDEQSRTQGFLSGWRLYTMSLGLSLAMFLVNIEVSVVATSLYAIVNDFQGFGRMGWIVTGYLITYTSTIIIWSRFSDIFGRKACMIIAMITFTAFSGGCGASQTMTQLIICRCFQGIGAAGCNSLGLTIAYEAVPQRRYPTYAALLVSMTALGSLIGPVVGGAFSEHNEWRWSFLFNVPIGALNIILLFISIPSRFPCHASPQHQFRVSRFSSVALKRLDIIGAASLLAASLLLVTVLLGGGIQFAWDSATAISLFVCSGILWITFMLNEYIVTKPQRSQNPIFPWESFFNRAWMATLLVSFFSGVPYIVAMIDIPQRFQLIYDTSALEAGVRLIPFNFLIAVGSVLVNIIVAKARVPVIVLLLGGSTLQLIGIALISTLKSENSIPHAIYAYQILAGLGIGIVIGLSLTLPPVVGKSKDFAMLAGAVLQFRIFGGALGLAIATLVMNNYVESHLRNIVTEEQRALLLKSVDFLRQLPDENRDRAVGIFVHAYNLRMKSLIGFCAAQFFSIALLWERPQIVIEKQSEASEQASSNAGQVK